MSTFNYRQLRSWLPELGFNFVLPWLVYRQALPVWGETGGLIASAIPPLLWSVVELLRFRRLDALSLIVLVGIVLSLIGLMMGGDARILLMRESLVSGLIGVAFLVSLLCKRPLIYYLAQATVARESAAALARFEASWQTTPVMKGMRNMTLYWGAGLTLETLIRAELAWAWPVERFLAISPLISYGMMGVLVALTWWERKRIRKALPLAA